ncbi:MAG: hypothetical protein AAF604_20070 [Acidobacteriota bacterium]
MTSHRRRFVAFCLAVFGALLLSHDLSACPVCFGEAEDPTLDAARWSVIFLGSLLYTVLASGCLLFFLLRRRARRLQGRAEIAG